MSTLPVVNRRTALKVGCGGVLGIAAVTGLSGCGAEEKAPSTPVEVARVADIPVGESIDATMNGEPILLAQPTAGTVVGFSAICTHKGCTVAATGTELVCPCHGSRCDAYTGEMTRGVAPAPLHPLIITLEGDAVFASI